MFDCSEVDHNRNQREIIQDVPRVPTQRRRSFGEDEDTHQRSNSAPSKKVEVTLKLSVFFVKILFLFYFFLFFFFFFWGGVFFRLKETILIYIIMLYALYLLFPQNLISRYKKMKILKIAFITVEICCNGICETNYK